MYILGFGMGCLGFFCISYGLVGKYPSKGAEIVCSRKTKKKLKGRNEERMLRSW